MSKLKPCPICGEQPDYQAFNATTCGGRIICSCGLEIRQGRNETREAIEAIWNTRADDAAELRDVLDLALDSKRVAEHEVSRLYAENAKLRELVHDLLQPFLADGFDCYGCVYDDCDGMQYTDRCKLLDRARELEVEVE